jgi:hypothetical protein
MKKIFYLVVLLWGFSAMAQLYTPSASELTEAEAQELFAELKLEDTKMDPKSECFERAHMWALRAEKRHAIAMEKVYLFFTYKFQMRHLVTSRFGRPFTWWFHVAPAVRVNGELMVMDASFTDRPLSVNDWARSLMRDPEDCVELQALEEYSRDRNASAGYRYVDRVRNQCYFIAAPRYFYQPMEMGFREAKGGIMEIVSPLPTPTDWRPNTWWWALNSYKRKNRTQARLEMGF